LEEVEGKLEKGGHDDNVCVWWLGRHVFFFPAWTFEGVVRNTRPIGSNPQTRCYGWVSPKVADLGRVEVCCAAVAADTRPTYKSLVRIRRRIYTVWV